MKKGRGMCPESRIALIGGQREWAADGDGGGGGAGSDGGTTVPGGSVGGGRVTKHITFFNPRVLLSGSGACVLSPTALLEELCV
jgi:hypothetical protein